MSAILSEFLLQRIAEDEAAARNSRSILRILDSHQPGALDPEDEPYQTYLHFDRWNPNRVLAECEAKRRIVESFAASEQPLTARTAEMAVVRMVLRLLALPYAAHPDFDPAWRVG